MSRRFDRGVIESRPVPRRRRPSKVDAMAGLPPRANAIDTGLVAVGIGASAGGLEACRKLLSALPADTGMAFVLVQHLDPTHESLMVDLLAGYTAMSVVQVSDGLRLEPDRLHVIPPGFYLSVTDGLLHLSPPADRHGARHAFDFLLRSMAKDFGSRAICIVLSGTGSDGSLGVRAIKAAGGLVIAQDPSEAGFSGMPRNAVETGSVDLVLPLAEIPAVLLDRARHGPSLGTAGSIGAPDRLAEIVALLRTRTPHDFTPYKPGTLRRRIERRMGMLAIAPEDTDRYLDRLVGDPAEVDLLAKDLLINVTRFFRDPAVFARLRNEIAPEMIAARPPEHPLRIWVAGCSTGEEAYSLAMVFQEAITESGRNIRLRVFASDVDADAVAVAREGLYPTTIETDVSAERLARFFTRDDQGLRVGQDLRSKVVFTVQDVLSDPPFSRMDLISCRNLLIYLGQQAQYKVMALFHFALVEGGLLLLGGTESLGEVGDRFEVEFKSERIWRRVGRGRPVDHHLVPNFSNAGRLVERSGDIQSLSRQGSLAELCRHMVMERFAPAAVLIDTAGQCLYSIGPTERFLRVAPGWPSRDLIDMTPPTLRTKLRAAIHRAGEKRKHTVVGGGSIVHLGAALRFAVDVTPLTHGGEEMMLVCFVEQAEKAARNTTPSSSSDDDPRVIELERELDATRSELHAAIRNLELSSEEQKAVTEEALSVNEEYQSTNEELLTSKEELQSLNEELTALNGQLQETLERHRTTADDLQNVLYSTDVATLFLDASLAIRFFTPATRSLFAILPGDIGRPLADLRSLAADAALSADARAVLRTLQAIEREIETETGTWFLRRVQPYRVRGDGVEGVVITFTDVTERRRTAQALDAARRQADLANLAKTRFLAAASHDLRQPLQTLCLLQGLLARTVQGDKAQDVVRRFDETLSAMTGMLDTLLDMNQIEAGTVRAEVSAVPIADLLDRMKAEFTYHAEAKGLSLRVVPSRLRVASDPRLLEQMLRNLLSNALKYTRRGKVLLGCRRHGDRVRIEVHDTGIGIPETELKSIFEEYHQIDNSVRERARGLGLGLSIVKRLGDLLGHAIDVRSRPGRGSSFAVEAEVVDEPPSMATAAARPVSAPEPALAPVGTVLVVEDDDDVRELLRTLLEEAGHRVTTVADGPAALDIVARGRVRPDLLLVDYNLPGGSNGVTIATTLRGRTSRPLPVIVLTGEISPVILREIAEAACVHVDKPMRADALLRLVARLLADPAAGTVAAAPTPVAAEAAPIERGAAVVYVVDDDEAMRLELRNLLESEGMSVVDHAGAEAFLATPEPWPQVSCLLIDAYLPGMSGLDLLRRLAETGRRLPAIMITGRSDVGMAVEAMKAGAMDFLEKPLGADDLVAAVRQALDLARDADQKAIWRETSEARLAGLTDRQREIMDLVLAGQPSKNIAADLGISQRTVENHRAAIMARTGAKSLPALARLVLAARGGADGDPPLRAPTGELE